MQYTAVCIVLAPAGSYNFFQVGIHFDGVGRPSRTPYNKNGVSNTNYCEHNNRTKQAKKDAGAYRAFMSRIFGASEILCVLGAHFTKINLDESIGLSIAVPGSVRSGAQMRKVLVVPALVRFLTIPWFLASRSHIIPASCRPGWPRAAVPTLRGEHRD